MRHLPFTRTLTLILFIYVTTAATTAFASASASNKISIHYAKGFRVEYRDDLTLLTVTNPWPGAQAGFKYLLVPTGKKVPKGFDDYQVVEVPVKRVIALSTTLLAFLEQLEVLEALVGFSDLSRVHSETIKSLTTKNKIITVGQGSNLQVETVLDLEPDIIFTYATGGFRDSHPKLLEAGLKVAIVNEYMESHPLGRSEWIKFMALFFNRGQQAEKLFSRLESKYLQLTTITKEILHKPTVITGVPFSGRWFVAGGNSFIGQFLKDAGADYIWKESSHSGAQPMDIELVYERGLEAEFWLNTGVWTSLDQAKRSDPRFLEFSSLNKKNLFNNNNRVNPQGGNDYWESGMMAPDKVLADLISIFHPQLLPDRQLFYYTHLQ